MNKSDEIYVYFHVQIIFHYFRTRDKPIIHRKKKEKNTLKGGSYRI